MLTLSVKGLPADATMAHVMVQLGVFPSMTQARKNNWDKPIVLGEQFLTKKRIHVNIVDRLLDEDETKPKDINRDRPDLEPGFWAEFVEPATTVSWAVQFPQDERFFDRMVNAFMRDEREKKRLTVKP